MTERIERCSNCKYHHSSWDTKTGSNTIECRRDPPKIVPYSKYSEGAAWWPIVCEKDWCGAFTPEKGK